MLYIEFGNIRIEKVKILLFNFSTTVGSIASMYIRLSFPKSYQRQQSI
ncbi:hypothetical protein [Spirosoma foliorum]|uniref:Uncharacterized protein n=1 Tax=Spirosoma foliorum TaxID=2710596 RepID=A0A7G5GN82_9BACT|nr:hypothetical protein [Spirosoma foliorum]QMW00324.1 hypothetical protein H3H32_20115 [Spirosoma foliorum]